MFLLLLLCPLCVRYLALPKQQRALQLKFKIHSDGIGGFELQQNLFQELLRGRIIQIEHDGHSVIGDDQRFFQEDPTLAHLGRVGHPDTGSAVPNCGRRGSGCDSW